MRPLSLFAGPVPRRRTRNPWTEQGFGDLRPRNTHARVAAPLTRDSAVCTRGTRRAATPSRTTAAPTPPRHESRGPPIGVIAHSLPGLGRSLFSLLFPLSSEATCHSGDREQREATGAAGRIVESSAGDGRFRESASSPVEKNEKERKERKRQTNSEREKGRQRDLTAGTRNTKPDGQTRKASGNGWAVSKVGRHPREHCPVDRLGRFRAGPGEPGTPWEPGEAWGSLTGFLGSRCCSSCTCEAERDTRQFRQSRLAGDRLPNEAAGGCWNLERGRRARINGF